MSRVAGLENARRCSSENWRGLPGTIGRFVLIPLTHFNPQDYVFPWQSSLDIAPIPAQNTPILSSPTMTRHPATASSNSSPLESGDMAARVEQVRMLILGMEQRLQVREEKLAKTIERAETEGHKFEEQHTALNA
ncbi:hypothetical protein C0991_007326 [Blastosporella zonata]|nr:hypothetical protein C0991_007326 [Blastosporella zonata]